MKVKLPGQTWYNCMSPLGVPNPQDADQYQSGLLGTGLQAKLTWALTSHSPHCCSLPVPGAKMIGNLPEAECIFYSWKNSKSETLKAQVGLCYLWRWWGRVHLSQDRVLQELRMTPKWRSRDLSYNWLDSNSETTWMNLGADASLSLQWRAQLLLPCWEPRLPDLCSQNFQTLSS